MTGGIQHGTLLNCLKKDTDTRVSHRRCQSRWVHAPYYLESGDSPSKDRDQPHAVHDGANGVPYGVSLCRANVEPRRFAQDS